ncbi:cell wall metabolism sensor histidine kinase WalK [Lacinutrix sp. Bg11-31]|uniref:sensor histidine kinase n=1 Tax=Lacinutrix sp. Bg11-31 TaxID=2057808 RepID=UPI000C30D36F|nr:ATP-binding protein [Lacinutrix sp. Bg11-31]AUC82608.1 two-component sensor histidine kinase [Lacinutrix sp. Bg11-31]
MEMKKTYKFAFKTSLHITAVLTLAMSIFLYAFYTINWFHLLLFACVCYGLAFSVIQYRAQNFIYKRINKIYEDLTLLESTTYRKRPVTTDMATLTAEIDRFARDKKIEIETLKIREEYRKEFLGNVSHELKTPLFTVQGYLETLIDGAAEDEKIREKYLDRASKGVERLVYIVKDLDMITKLEAGDVRIQTESFNIIELIESVFDLFEMKAAKKKITLTLDRSYLKPILVKADKDKIQQVLTNLVVNSIKYGKEKGTTEISVDNLIKNKVIVRVTDNGEGVIKENIPRLFERFFRVDKSGSRKEGGSGLGLAIVKHIIEAHDEKIYIESEFGVGSEFSFTLEKTK